MFPLHSGQVPQGRLDRLSTLDRLEVVCQLQHGASLVIRDLSMMCSSSLMLPGQE